MTSATAGEQPDVLGMNAWAESILVEVKVSRADFLADKKKPWRQKPEIGIGDRRVYLTPADLIKPEEVPYGWEFWEVHGKNKPQLKVIKGWKKVKEESRFSGKEEMVTRLVGMDRDEHQYFKNLQRDKRSEAMWALKIIGRMIKAGFPVEKFANAAELKAMGVIKTVGDY